MAARGAGRRCPRPFGNSGACRRSGSPAPSPNDRFTLYTRGNVGEVFPRVMTALTRTLIGDAVARGQNELFVEMGVLGLTSDRPVGGHGRVRGYLYSSGSAMRLFGVRMPGMWPVTRKSR